MPGLCITSLLHEQFNPEYSGLVIKRKTSVSDYLLLVEHFSPPSLYLGSGQKPLCNHAGRPTSDLMGTGLNLAKILPWRLCLACFNSQDGFNCLSDGVEV